MHPIYSFNILHKIALNLLVLLWLTPLALWAQPKEVQGQVRDAKGHPLPYAMILSSDLPGPIHADSLGQFSIPAYSQKHHLHISARHFVPKNIVLPYNYKEKLLVYLDPIPDSADFNPYEIIRRAQILREKNFSTHALYKAQVFKSSEARMDRTPRFTIPMGRLLPGKKDTGLLFHSEEKAIQGFMGQHRYLDTTTHFQAAGSLPLSNILYQSEKDLSLYQNKISFPELSYSYYYSPLSDQALSLYNFEAVAIYANGQKKIYRIRFSPKKPGTPCLTGHLDLYDSLFTIAECSFGLTPSAHLEILDSLKVNQYYYYQNDQYHKARQDVELHINVNGYMGYYATKTFYEPRQNRGLNEGSRQVLLRDSLSIVDDSAYWKGQRKHSLNSEAAALFKQKNLNNYYREKYSRVPHLKNTFKPLQLLYRKQVFESDEHYFYFKPLYQALGYNTVEGLYGRYDLPIRLYKNQTEIMLKPEVRFGSADLDFKSRLMAEFTYDKSNPKKVSVEFGHVVDQFNSETPVSPLINSIYSLLFSRNYLKLYGKDYFKAGYKTEIANGFEMQSSIEFASRFPLYNNTSFVLTGTPQGFTPNNPEFDEDINEQGFENHQALTFWVQFAYHFHQKYEMINGRKVDLRMRTPRVYLNYRQGIQTSISQTRYSLLSGGITFNSPAGSWGFTQWDLSGGGFFGANRVEFVDYQHFNGTQTFYLEPHTYYYHSIKQFSTLGYYDLSTKVAFIELHTEHHFNGSMLSRIGFVRRSQVHSYLGINYLHNFTGSQYYEFLLGLDNIHSVMRMEFALGTRDFNGVQPTLVVGIDFDLLYYAKNRIR